MYSILLFISNVDLLPGSTNVEIYTNAAEDMSAPSFLGRRAKHRDGSSWNLEFLFDVHTVDYQLPFIHVTTSVSIIFFIFSSLQRGRSL
jgi:hypothetical protein